MIIRKQNTFWRTNHNNKQGAYAEEIALKLNRKKYKEEKESTIDFESEFKQVIMIKSKEIQNAVKEDKEDEFIIDLMYKELEGYILNRVMKQNYEKVLMSYLVDIPLEKAKEIYPTLESLAENINWKLNQIIKTYDKIWIDHIRIKYATTHKGLDSAIDSMLRAGKDNSTILEKLMKKDNNIATMKNLRLSVERKIYSAYKSKEKDKSKAIIQTQGEK